MDDQALEATDVTCDGAQPYRVLCLDGGGMRGLYTAVLLRRLVVMFHRGDDGGPLDLDIGRGFDLICGTSTGSILATALTCGTSLDEIIDLYRNKGPLIFRSPMPQGLKWLGWLWRHRARPCADAAELRSALEAHFRRTTLEEVFRERGIALCIQAIDACSGKPKVFKTPHFPKKQDDNDVTLVDAVLASSAAPIFFPVHVFQRRVAVLPSEFIDGGLWANNPVLVGLIEALAHAGSNRPIHIISIGTGLPPKQGVGGRENPHRGIVDWVRGLSVLDVSMRAQAHAFAYMADQLAQSLRCGSRDIRIYRLHQQPPPPELARHLTLDDASEAGMAALMQLGEEDAKHNHHMSNAIAEPAALLHDTFATLSKFPRRKHND